MSYGNEPEKSDRLIRKTNETQEKLEAALRKLESYANALEDVVSSLRKRTQDD